MRRKQILIYAAVTALAVGLFACQKQSSTPASGPSSLNLAIQAVNPSYSMPVSNSKTKSSQASGSSITWDTAQMVVSSVKFEASLKKMNSEEDSVEIEYKWMGPKTVNLLDTTTTFGNFTLQPGLYDQVELKISGFREDAAGMPVFYLHGTYMENDTTSWPIIVESYQDVMFKTEKDSVNVTANMNSDITSYIKIYLDKLMANVQPSDLDNAMKTNGTIVISDSSNVDLYRTILYHLDEDHPCFYRHWDDHRDR